jgi:hypothetical protein
MDIFVKVDHLLVWESKVRNGKVEITNFRGLFLTSNTGDHIKILHLYSIPLLKNNAFYL